MKSWHDDLGRLCNSNDYTTVRRTYCEQHFRKLQFDDRSRDNRNEDYYEFSENESLVNSLESSTTTGESERRFQQFESPTTSCLKSLPDTKKNKNKKRVNFAFDEEEEETELPIYNTYASSSISSSHRSSSTITKNATAIARRRSNYVKQICRTNQSTSPDVVQSSTSAFEGLSLSSSDNRCFTSMNTSNNSNLPRIVKPRDVLRRPAARKMMIYPPEGQRGEPLTLTKKWSKIQSRVNGDEDAGYRYKVYYLQTFESDKWFANNKSNGPFCPNDDDNDDHSTD